MHAEASVNSRALQADEYGEAEKTDLGKVSGGQNGVCAPQRGPLGVWITAIHAGLVPLLYEVLEGASSDGLIHGGLEAAVRSEFLK